MLFVPHLLRCGIPSVISRVAADCNYNKALLAGEQVPVPGEHLH